MHPEQRHELLLAYSEGRTTAIEARTRLDGVTFGELLRMLADADLPLPKAPTAGREESIARAREWLFPPGGKDG